MSNYYNSWDEDYLFKEISKKIVKVLSYQEQVTFLENSQAIIKNLETNSDVFIDEFVGYYSHKIIKNPQSNYYNYLKKNIKLKEIQIINDLEKCILKNIDDPSLNVSFLCKSIGVSRTRLHRILKVNTGYSTTRFVREIKLSYAASLILHNDDSVTQIGYKSGFSDHSYFSKCFKSKFGESPCQFAKLEQKL